MIWRPIEATMSPISIGEATFQIGPHMSEPMVLHKQQADYVQGLIDQAFDEGIKAERDRLLSKLDEFWSGSDA